MLPALLILFIGLQAAIIVGTYVTLKYQIDDPVMDLPNDAIVAVHGHF